MAAAADAAGRQVRGAAALPPPSGAYSRSERHRCGRPQHGLSEPPAPTALPPRPAPPAGGVGLALSPCWGGGGEGGGALAWQPAGGVPWPGWGLCWGGVAEGRGLGGGGDRESSASGV